MKVLVTGADGLLGSNLIRELLGQGFTVRAFIQRGSRSPTLEGLAIEKVSGDLLDEGDALKQAAAGCDAVFHCAAITNLWADRGLVFKVNLEGTRKVLDACVAAGVKRLVFTGSASSFQFGPMEKPGDETGAFPPEYKGMPYMESKHQAMKLVRDYIAKRGLDAVIVSPTFMLGPHDFGPSSGELVRQFIKRRMRFVSPGGRNFAYAGDVAKAMVAALERGRKNECYILAGKNLNYLDFFGRAAKIAGIQPPKSVLPSALVKAAGAAGSAFAAISRKPAQLNLTMARMACLGTYYTGAKAIKELGLPQTDVDQALAETIQNLREFKYL